jgi:DNA-binding response OmpR family regulator
MATVLLVDDDIDSLFALQLIVEGQGHRVILARDGEVAMGLAGGRLPDAIIGNSIQLSLTSR